MFARRTRGRPVVTESVRPLTTAGVRVTSRGSVPTRFRMRLRRSRTLSPSSRLMPDVNLEMSVTTTPSVVGSSAGSREVSLPINAAMTSMVAATSRGVPASTVPTSVARTVVFRVSTVGRSVATRTPSRRSSAGSRVDSRFTTVNNRFRTSRLSTLRFVINVVTTLVTFTHPTKPLGSKNELNRELTPFNLVRSPGFMTLLTLLNMLFNLDMIGSTVDPVPLVIDDSLDMSPSLETPENTLLKLPLIPEFSIPTPELNVSASPLNLIFSSLVILVIDRFILEFVTPVLSSSNGFASPLVFRWTWPMVDVNGLLLMVRVLWTLPPKHDPNRRRFARSDRSRLGTRPSPLASRLTLLLLSPLSALNMPATPLMPLLILVNNVNVLVNRLRSLMTLRMATSLLRNFRSNRLTSPMVSLIHGASPLPNRLMNGASRSESVLMVGTVVPNAPCNDLSVSPLGFLFNWSRVVPMPVKVLSNALLVVNVVLFNFLRTVLVKARKLTPFPEITLDMLLEAAPRRPVSTRRMGMLESTSRSTLLFRSPFCVVMDLKTALTLASDWFETRVALVMAPRIPATRLLDVTLVVDRSVVMAVVLFNLNVAFPISVSVPPTTLSMSPVLRLRFPSPVRVPLTPRVWAKLFPVVSVAMFLATALTVLSLSPLTPLNVPLRALARSFLSPSVVALISLATLFLRAPLKLPLEGVIRMHMALTLRVTGASYFDSGAGLLTVAGVSWRRGSAVRGACGA